MTTFVNSQRANPTWVAALIHRLSGLGLVIFLPIHLYVLAFALEGEAKLDSFLKWTDWWPVKLAEGGLVFLLLVHMLGGLRLLMLENLVWSKGQAKLAGSAIALSIVLAIVFLARVL